GTTVPAAQLIGKFATDVGLLETATARAHGGARGGGSPQMLAHFESIMDPGGKPLTVFLGNLQGVHDWMQGYSTMAQPTQSGPSNQNNQAPQKPADGTPGVLNGKPV